MKDILHITVEGLSRPIALIGCRDLIDHFPVIFRGWKFSEIPKNALQPILTLRRDKSSGYILQADWLDKPMKRKDRVAAICALVAELVRGTVNDNAKSLCLHGAAANFSGKLVVFPNKYRAGKSILSACLAAANVQLFGDDVLPISLSEGQGIAPGLALRLRLPLPDNLSPESRDFIEANVALKSNQYLYLDLDHDLLATRHSLAPVGAFVLLEREENITPSLEVISESEVLHQVVWQNFVRETDAPEILERLSQMVASAKRYRLRYDRAEDAVTLLKATFKDWPETEKQSSPVLQLSQKNFREPIEVPPDCYLRKADISVVTVDGEGFLADAEGSAIHHLNQVGSAIWNLLVEPTTMDDMIELLQIAFPEVSRKQVESDIGTLLKSLKSKDLLIMGSSLNSSK